MLEPSRSFNLRLSTATLLLRALYECIADPAHIGSKAYEVCYHIADEIKSEMSKYMNEDVDIYGAQSCAIMLIATKDKCELLSYKFAVSNVPMIIKAIDDDIVTSHKVSLVTVHDGCRYAIDYNTYKYRHKSTKTDKSDNTVTTYYVIDYSGTICSYMHVTGKMRKSLWYYLPLYE